VSEEAIGRVIGIARRSARRAAMEEIAEGMIAPGSGLEGDHKGAKFPHRAITVLSREAWEAALAELGGPAEPVALPWTARRANILVEGVDLPRARGGRVRIGPALLEVTYPTQPCARMEEAHAGLLRALHPDWRGGITARVLEGGVVRLGDPVSVVLRPPERRIALPG
jgi:MOSC domain-containing protein YiiM